MSATKVADKKQEARSKHKQISNHLAVCIKYAAVGKGKEAIEILTRFVQTFGQKI